MAMAVEGDLRRGAWRDVSGGAPAPLTVNPLLAGTDAAARLGDRQLDGWMSPVPVTCP